MSRLTAQRNNTIGMTSMSYPTDSTRDLHNLHKNQRTLTRADECQRSGYLRGSRFTNKHLNFALNTFCSHKPEIEGEASCWTSKELPGTVVSCFKKDKFAFAECAYQGVSNLRECTNTIGAIFRQLILGVFR
ncbi:uncharacterized protein LOC124119848 isoform X2 [Haliotis rufescens]|uniref:uncharacterized protein LOC124119848 isoform X2 n=1 Tax=Haliotis rufescens TaxID=6454 RepID=UPI00201F7AED|nr:uncharacterized protein LOC124119848 isoform X2 [Haliotis rufescens]